MTDLTTRLLDDIRFLHGEAEKARETLRFTDATLDHRWEELEILSPEAAEELRAELEAAPSLKAEAEPLATAQEDDSEAGGPPAEEAPLKHLRLRREVNPAIKKGLPYVDDTFTQNDMDAALEREGFYVNRTTLRGNLQEMARLRDRITIERKGKGRKATIFRKLAAVSMNPDEFTDD